MSDAHAELLARLARHRRGPAIHPYGGLEDTPDGVRFRCLRCGLLTSEQWAAPCPAPKKEFMEER